MIPSPNSSPRPAIAVADPVPHLLRDLVHERIGVYFDDDRLGTMLDKLQDRVAHHGCASFLDYYYILKYDEQGTAEWRRVMDAFSVQETYFWREHDQIEVLVGAIVPAWFRDHQEPLRIWSAACASGEEPYSIAIALREAGWGRHPIEIIASDASEAALERARRGLYRERAFRALPDLLRERYFSRQDQAALLHDEIRAAVHFQWANLVDPASFPPHVDRCHVVFCRNVFIYFSSRAIRRTIASFADLVPPRGHLFVGASESLLKLTDDFELTELRGTFAYVRTEPKAALPA